MSTTLLETFDAQMLDYQNDADFSMNLSSSESWFQDEATMEDDGRNVHLEHPDTAIEVDMDSYDETNNLEYEMDDGSQSLDLDTADIVDVEVYDASRAHSPEAIHHHGTPALPVSDSTDLLPIPTEFLEPSPSHLTPPTRSERSSNTFTPDIQYRSASPLHLHASTTPIDRNEVFHADTGDEHLSPSHAQDSERSLQKVPDDKIGGEAGEPISGEYPDVKGKGLDIPADADQGASEEVTETYDIESSPQVSGETFEDQLYQYGTEGVDFHPSTASTGDPHEISEGVYIDPPPAVLISLPVGSLSFSLFNAPSKSRTGTPSNDERNIPDLVVLLGHLPTLYYEPLSSVFEALRGDEYLSRMPDLLSGELLLDAYDLELVMSEDYTFAHELSLHDLNVLHDGLNKPGPLRLRLRTATPRFIDRYRVLQEQIAQFQITDSSTPVVEHSGEELHEQDTGGDVEPQVAFKQHVEEQDEQDAEHSEDDQHRENGKATTEDHVLKEAAVEAEQAIAEYPQHGAQEDPEELESLPASKDAGSLSHEESTAPVVETDHTRELSGLNASEAESGETEEYDDQDEEHYSEQYHEQHDEPDDDYTAHLEIPQDEEDPRQEAEDLSSIPAPVTESEADEEHVAALFLQTSSNITTSNTPSTRTENLHRDDSQNSDLADLQDASEQPGCVSSNLDDLPDAELDLMTNVEGEPKQAGSSADETLVAPVHAVLETGDASYELDAWDDTLDGEGDPDTNWELEDHEHETASNLSSVTLSSKTSTKRSLSEAELEEYEDEGRLPSSPNSKRPRGG